MGSSRSAWLKQFGGTLRVDSPTDREVDLLLEVASIAARASERNAAPLSCWLIARSGFSVEDGVDIAKKLAQAMESS